MNPVKKIFFMMFFSIGLLETSACEKEVQTNVPTQYPAGENTPLPTSVPSETTPTPTVTVFPAATQFLTPTPIPTGQVSTLTPKPTEPVPVPTKPTPTLTLPPTPTEPSIPKTLSPKPTESTEPTPLIDPKISYLSIPMKGGEMAVYISKDPARPQVVIRKKGENLCSFDWDYNLEYGSPAAYEIKDQKKLESLGLTDGDGLLAIWLPVKTDGKHTLPYYESHKVYCLSLKALSGFTSDTAHDTLYDSFVGEKLLETLTTGYAKSEDSSIWKDQNLFTIFSADKTVLQQYPALCLPAGKEYPLVYGEMQVDWFGSVSQQFGIDVVGDILWLGRYDNEKFYLRDEGYFFDLDTRYDPYLYSWWPRKFADEGESTELDLDGDGITEQVFWYAEGEDNSRSLKMSINGAEYEIPSPEWGLYSPVFTLSLDGNTNQLAIIDYAYGCISSFKLFGYYGQAIYEIGEFPLTYQKSDRTDSDIFISPHDCYPLQNDHFLMTKKFSGGMLQQVPQNYYEFIRKPKDSSHVLSVKQSIDLYCEKDGKDTFILPEGSHAMTLGTDFKEWILIENLDTKELGWLHVPMEEYVGKTCILPDGSELQGEEIFDGLDNWISG